MMEGNPNWWSMNNMQPPPHQPSSFSLFPYEHLPESNSSLSLNQDFPHSWSHPLLGGDQENRFGGQSNEFQSMKLGNWETQIFDPSLKQEIGQRQGDGDNDDNQFQGSWSQIVMPVSSPSSCVTTLNTNILDFSNSFQHQDHSSECNSGGHGGISKKARLHSPPTQPPLKVRKEKLGDRITALHQIVSPFGKTDTASVLLEAIGYIRFLQSQIEALSSPYLGNASGNTSHQHSVQGERHCMFPADSGQFLHNNSLNRRASSKQSTQDGTKDLRSRGLCLVPVSCTHHVGNDNGADYWNPPLGGGF